MSRLRRRKMMALPVAVLLASLASCSFIDEDLQPCPNVMTRVNFVYDYNMQYTDLITDHVGSVYLYVFDSQGIFRIRREAHRVDMGDLVDFSMTFDSTEIRPGHTYQFVAVASANHVGLESILETPGFQLQTDMVEGTSKIEDYILKLDRDGDSYIDFGVVNYKDAYGDNQEMMDTIWTTKPDEVQVLNVPKVEYKMENGKFKDIVNEVEIPLMRITNAITVNIKGAIFSEATLEDDYITTIHFPHGNGTIDFTGTTYPAQELYYRSLRKKIVNFSELERSKTRADGDVYGIQSVFGVSRLQTNDESSLQLWDAKTNELVTEIPDFSDFLAKAFDHGCDDDQEFLDREYDFTVELTVDKDGDPLYADISISILGWVKRIFFYSI